MCRLFENMDGDIQRRKHDYRRSDRSAGSKHILEDIHYMMQYSLHI